MANHWADKKEKGNLFFLKLTIILVKYCPKFLLEKIIFIVTFFYYIFSREERKSIKSYRKHLQNFMNNKSLEKGLFFHFYSFAEAICDKFAVWQGKISLKNVIFKNKDFLLSELVGQKKGQIILVSHLGNIEISSAISEKFSDFYLNVLVLDKHAKNFNETLNSFTKNKIKLIHVDKLDIGIMLSLKKMIDKGEHIGIMGDRVPLKKGRVSEVKFLGQNATFPQGAYLLSGLLKTKISTLWCQKVGLNYEIELCPLCEGVNLSNNKNVSIKPYLEKYVKELEKRCIQTPYQWYNFYDFWSENDRV